MNPILRNILAFIAAWVAGSIVNMGLIITGNSIFPLPEGTDPMDPASLAAAMEHFSTGNYIFPFLAHALGTLVGAFVVSKLAAGHQFKLAMGIAAFFLLGGVINAINLPAPLWFEALDLIVAYIPMGWLGWKMAGAKK
ncbi:MAG: hypothetical protein HKN32_05280 [Flavobacteriales bacterium]|nr:hypothetical protein [Flavobacteriales bacterium]